MSEVSTTIPCPVCNAPDTTDLGPPTHRQPPAVARVPIELSDLSLRFRRCEQCEYKFIFPRIPEQRLLDCYARSVDAWGTGESVADQRAYAKKKDLLVRFAPKWDALDFGCYDGGFLEYLGASWAKAGIEPSTHAADRAKQRGVEIIAKTIESDELARYNSRFGAIINFDVIEHLVDPVATLSRLRDLLMPQGIMLIETANTDAPEHQKYGKRHPYCGLVEHVGFFNRKSIETAGRRAGYSLVHFEPSQHFDFGPPRNRYHWHNRAYGMIRWLADRGLPLPRRLREIAAGPIPRALDPIDHFLAVLRKND